MTLDQHPMTDASWRDPSRPLDDRVDALIAQMTLDEKLAQLYGVWVGASDDGHGDVAPHQHDLNDDVDLDDAASVGARPAHPAVRHRSGRRRASARSRSPAPSSASSPRTGSASRRSRTRSASRASRRGARPPTRFRCRGARRSIPRSSSGCPAGSATTCARSACTRGSRPCSTSCATRAGAGSRRPSARTPTSSATIGTAYVRGLESSGVVATLKHFVGYSASRAGRNLAPVSIGRRELADVLLPPFEMAIREGGARSGDELLHRPRRRAVGRRPLTAHRAAARDVGLRRHRRRRLLRGRVPQAAARHGRHLGRGGRAPRSTRASTSSCPR